ncbi:MAG: hypothetical protein JNL01_12990 [Bdellovibrionales bacterium]|nr:hypothetical protein [Bdellovibrionales bacterium]
MNSIEKFIIFAGIGLTGSWLWISHKNDADLPTLPDLPATSQSSIAEVKEILAPEKSVGNAAVQAVSPPAGTQPNLAQAMNQVIAKIENENPDLRLDQIKDHEPPPALAEPGTASLFDAAKTENEIDQLQRSSGEEAMVEALGGGRQATLLRRIIMNRRHAGKIADGDKLEGLYLQELGTDVDASILVLGQALKALPKTDYREEHLIIREIANQLPEGHTKLQASHPDEEFQ